MRVRQLSFRGDESIAVRECELPAVTAEDVLVKVECSAISPGTERLAYRGELPDNVEAVGAVSTLDGTIEYPLAYGYAAVGEVREVGATVEDSWVGKRVFAYAPHGTHVVTSPEELVPVPEGLESQEAALFATVETAVTLLLDGRPAIGERVVVHGQGLVGLVTTGLLAHTPAASVTAVEPVAGRQELARSLGADRTVERVPPETAADLSYELSGDPAALDAAIDTTAFDGRVVVGSWYGDRPVSAHLGRHFHRNRIAIESSQVSTIPPRERGRWSRGRRTDVTWSWLERLDLDRLITHRVDFENAGRAYELLEECPGETVGVVLTC